MPNKRKIADEAEILKILTEIMRDDEEKTGDRLSAADKLHKYLKEDAAETESDKKYGVVILPAVKEMDGGNG